ncbi:MAG: T9SS type A sorting domain-containing protein [Bacteroidia bacterium]|nr:T9SS type A sorting domain-containing protein [Bacteroidia bacterium]
MRLSLNFLFALLLIWALPAGLVAQVNVDTLAFQDFENTPQSPVWTYTGTPNALISGFSAAGATPASSPLGIGGSQAWHVVSVSAGNALTFANTVIPAGYDTIRVRFNLAAMNLNGSSGGPDDLDYVLVEYSLNGGSSFVQRIRVRGALANNCSWPYTAASTARAWYLPASEQVFQPANSGLQLIDGLGTVELLLPGTITSLMMRITPRSSSSTDSWLVDNLVLEGQNACTPSTSALTVTQCYAYTTPSGQVLTQSGQYADTIPNSTGCDSIISINLTVNPGTQGTVTVASCYSYTSPGGQVLTATGTYMDTLTNANGCDSVLTIDLTILERSYDTLTVDACDSYLSPGGQTLTATGSYQDTLANGAGCDSVLTIHLTVTTIDTTVQVVQDTLVALQGGASYQWLDCGDNFAPIAGATGQSYGVGFGGNFALEITLNGCVDTSYCHDLLFESRGGDLNGAGVRVWPNPVEGRLQLEFPAGLEVQEVALVNVTGQRLISRDLTTGSRRVSLDLGDLPAGIYLVRVVSGKGILAGRVVKE